MPSLDLMGVDYAHRDDVPLLRQASLHVEPGWTGVVGANGAGKTTLLRLLSGSLRPNAGRVQHSPGDMRIHLCGQEVERLDATVERFAADEGGEARRLRGRLGLEAGQLARWSCLSPGERKRWQIAAALASGPGALLLDEPTNHLDPRARGDLLGALARYRGIGVVVSHDRSLLERLTTHTVRIHRGTVSLHRGSYGQARCAWEAELHEALSAHAKLAHERRKERARLADKRRDRTRAESRMRTSRMMKSRHDSDARLRGKQKRRRSAEASLGRDIQLSRRRLERIDADLAGFHFDKPLGGSLFVDFVPAPVPHLMSLETPALARGGRVLARDLRLWVGRESRIHVAGPNGSGKSSLLEALLRHAHVPPERLLYLPQELAERETSRLLQEVRSLAADRRGLLMKLVAALGVDPGALLASGRLSPGEARKLALASGLARQVFGVVLDEPTNHLDLPSIERLEETLTGHPGALVVVSHDDAFAARLCDERWVLEGGELRVEWLDHTASRPGSPC